MKPCEIGLVNCANPDCDKELIGERTEKHFELSGEKDPLNRPPIGGRIKGRPYCESCLDTVGEVAK